LHIKTARGWHCGRVNNHGKIAPGGHAKGIPMFGSIFIETHKSVSNAEVGSTDVVVGTCGATSKHIGLKVQYIINTILGARSQHRNHNYQQAKQFSHPEYSLEVKVIHSSNHLGAGVVK
jgi:purine-nucleoside phosphorylase